ncbi:hypothetical protein JYU34_014111 [Plutella xylostella]|uniref:Uncharacterized protein n=1 Tax=Plutella xylostella TaxID=51655 RepID=A0ABQ7QB88_PLUXY|nr:hypothetical protein JYU34_014111 [Plutella xylostella]
MDADKAFKFQRQARDNVTTLQNYLTDLQNWEVEMKRKEGALNGQLEQDLPPIRSKIKKEKPVAPVKRKPEKRIAAFDYSTWDKFDVDKACEEVDMEDVGPTSLDGKKSLTVKQEKLREEAQYEKERGNAFVKQEKWDDAITCYNRAIELVTDDAIYYANRGLCHLKKDSLHQAEKDCTEALRLDPTYVKALQRRATAREKLGSLRAASHDLNQVLALEPHNAAARNQLRAIKARMGTKGTKSKSSPVSTPTSENKSMLAAVQPKIIELEDDAKPAPIAKAEVKTEQPPKLSLDEKWINGVGENINVIKPVKKPPHLRSKRGLKSIPIQEIQLGKSEPEKPPTRLKIIEIENSQAKGDTNNNKSDTNKIDTIINPPEIKKDGVKVESRLVPKVPKDPKVPKGPKVPKVPKVPKDPKVAKVTKVPKVAKVAKVPKIPKATKVAKVPVPVPVHIPILILIHIPIPTLI